MKIYFTNDGSFGQSAVNAPVHVNGFPVGFISEVNQEKVTCCIWQKFTDVEVYGMSMSGECEVHSIGIKTHEL